MTPLGCVRNGASLWPNAHPPNWEFGRWDRHYNFYLCNWLHAWETGSDAMRALLPEVGYAQAEDDIANLVSRESAMWMLRKPLVERFGFAVPWTGALDAIREAAAGRGVIELGPGGGYWARCLRLRGISVRAVEPLPGARTHLTQHGFWHPIESRADPASALDEGPAGRLSPVLFLCWPGMDDWADAALARFRGDTVAYVGEWFGGCCASDAFFERLERWGEQRADIDIPQWPGIHDSCRIYRRHPVAAVGLSAGRLP